MSIDEKVFKFPKNFCWETNGQLAELIKQAEEQLPHLEENSIGYYYYWMLQEMKKLVSAPQQPVECREAFELWLKEQPSTLFPKDAWLGWQAAWANKREFR